MSAQPPRLPRTVIIPYADLLKSALKIAELPDELATTHDFTFHGDVSPGKGAFTLTLLSATPKEPTK